MTRADVEELLKTLDETKRYLRETSRLVRAAAEHVAQIHAAMTARLRHL